MSSMISTDVLHVVVDNPSDMLGPLIGIVGVLIGAAIGWGGIAWQHHENSKKDIRGKAAELMSLGKSVFRSFMEPSNPGDRMGQMFDPTLQPQELKAALNKMTAIVAFLRLAATDKEYQAGLEFLMATEPMQRFVPGPVSPDVVRSWSDAESRLLAVLQKHRSKPARQ